eukprot:9679221-Heterocapsa_arctica.AAC.1
MRLCLWTLVDAYSYKALSQNRKCLDGHCSGSSLLRPSPCSVSPPGASSPAPPRHVPWALASDRD